MHILYTTYEFVTERKPCGGMGHYLANIATILAQHGHNVTILLLTNYNKNFEWKKNVRVIAFKYEYVAKGLHIEEYIDRSLHTNISPFVNKSLAFKIKIKEINKENKIDIVQYNGDHLECWHRCRQIPSVVRLSSFTPWCHHAYNPYSNMEDMSWLNTWETRLFLYPLKRADAVYGPSECVAKLLLPRISRSIKIIESPFIMEEGNLENKLPQELKGKKYFLFFGRLCVLKGINTIVSSIYQILDENRDFYFIFAGNIEQKGLVERLLNAASIHKSRIIIMEEIKEKEIMQSIVKNAYACILPSRADNLPNSCIEAMGMGKIVIGTYGASFEQLIQNKKNGLLIKRDSSKSLLRAIRYLISMNPKMRSEMEKLARKRVEKMKPEIIYQQVINFYQNIINKKKRI